VANDNNLGEARGLTLLISKVLLEEEKLLYEFMMDAEPAASATVSTPYIQNNRFSKPPGVLPTI
jgi:hypothetical protein